MSATNGLDIDFPHSERRTLLYFLLLYALLTVSILLLLAYIYFSAQKEIFLQKERPLMQEFASSQAEQLKRLHRNFGKERIYPRAKEYKSAIYDASKKQIFSMLANKPDLNKILYLKNSSIHYIIEPESYYLGAKYLVIERASTKEWVYDAYRDITLYGLLLFSLMLFIGYLLFSLMLGPMRRVIKLLDRFIKDTAHELNTPVNAITANVEMLRERELDGSAAKKIERIDIAAKTIANLYEDMKYMLLFEKLKKERMEVALEELISERIEYFSILAAQKGVNLKAKIRCRQTLVTDRKKLAKLLDNLIANGIKYNRQNGYVEVGLQEGSLYVKDSGIGVDEDKIKAVFERYSRFEDVSGGFGIGLSIVQMIAKELHLKVEFHSKKGVGSKVVVRW